MRKLILGAIVLLVSHQIALARGATVIHGESGSPNSTFIQNHEQNHAVDPGVVNDLSGPGALPTRSHQGHGPDITNTNRSGNCIGPNFNC